MKKLMYNIVYSDIKLAELKLKRIKLSKKRLLESKPCRLNVTKYRIWQEKLNKLKHEEESISNELHHAYIDLEELL